MLINPYQFLLDFHEYYMAHLTPVSFSTTVHAVQNYIIFASSGCQN